VGGHPEASFSPDRPQVNSIRRRRKLSEDFFFGHDPPKMMKMDDIIEGDNDVFNMITPSTFDDKDLDLNDFVEQVYKDWSGIKPEPNFFIKEVGWRTINKMSFKDRP
jgi:hypothetical protein